jgi:hypothetical protein
MNEQVKTDVKKRSHDNQHVLWAKLSAVRVGIVDKEQVKLGNQRDYLTWIPIAIAKLPNLLKHGYDLDRLGQVYTVNTKQYKQAMSK